MMNITWSFNNRISLYIILAIVYAKKVLLTSCNVKGDEFIGRNRVIAVVSTHKEQLILPAKRP